MTLTISSYLSIEQPTLEKVYNVFISQFHAMTVERLTDAQKDLQIRQLKGRCMLYIIRRVDTDTQNEDALAEIAISWIGRRDTVRAQYLTTAMEVDDRGPLGDYEARENAILRKTEQLVKRMGFLLKVILYWNNLTPDQKTEEIRRFQELLNTRNSIRPDFMEPLTPISPRNLQERPVPLRDIGRSIQNQLNINQDGGSKYNNRNKKKKQKKSKKRSKKSIKNKKKSRRGSSTNKKVKKIKRKLSLSRRQGRKT